MSNNEDDGVKVTLERVNMHTRFSNDRIKFFRRAAAAAELDVHQTSRRSRFECCTCFYFHRTIAGQAFSEKPCKNLSCDGPSKHSTTDVPDYCEGCARKYGICRRCGGDLELVERSSLKPTRRR